MVFYCVNGVFLGEFLIGSMEFSTFSFSSFHGVDISMSNLYVGQSIMYEKVMETFLSDQSIGIKPTTEENINGKMSKMRN